MIVNRRELEGLIELSIASLRAAEQALARDHKTLPQATPEERRSFTLKLHEIRRQAKAVDALLNTLASTIVPKRSRIVA